MFHQIKIAVENKTVQADLDQEKHEAKLFTFPKPWARTRISLYNIPFPKSLLLCSLPPF